MSEEGGKQLFLLEELGCSDASGARDADIPSEQINQS